MRRRTLLALALMLPSGTVAQCPTGAEAPRFPVSTVVSNCIAAMNGILGDLKKLKAGGDPDPAALADLVKRHDELRERVAGLREVVTGMAKAEVEFQQTFPGQEGATLTDPFKWNQRLSTAFDAFSEPSVWDPIRGAVEEHQDDQSGVRPQPVGPDGHEIPVAAPTPEKQEAARDRAADAEERLPETPAPAQALRVASDFLRGADPEGAVRVLDRAGEDGGGDPKLLNLRSAARYQTKDWSGAYQDAQRALALDPSNARAAELAGAARMMLRKLGLKEPRLAAPERPGDEADAEAAGGAWGAGGAHVGGAGASGRREAAAQFWASGQAKLRIGDRRGALLDLARVLERDPRHLLALVQRANLLNHGPKPDHAAALAEAEKALAVAPSDPGALRERAYALVGLGRFAEALAAAEEALRAEPASALGHLYRAMALQGLGRRDESLAEFKRAAELDATLREYYDEALDGPKSEEGKASPALPVPGKREARYALLAGGLALMLWGLWKGGRLAAGWTTRGAARASEGDAPPEGAAAPGTLAPGTLLGGLYRVGGVLGRGGMGVVYEAVDIGLERPVAVKELRAPDTDSELFLREARLVAALQHPGIVQIFSLTEHGGRLYMVFERVAGRSLDAELAERGRMAPEAVRGILRDVCPALAHAHESKVIHRDLKPSNLMRAADGRTKVMDFGIAHRASRTAAATRTEAWGTPPYMAPEQEEGRVSPESDLYALACTAYELLTGARPFNGTAEKLRGRFRPPSEAGLPAALDPFMARALDADPARRYHTAAEFLAAFEGALTDRAVA